MIKNKWVFGLMHLFIIMFFCTSILFEIPAHAEQSHENNLFIPPFESSLSEIPDWNVGDQWTYRVTYQEQLDEQTFIKYEINNFQMKVINDQAESYYCSLSGLISGDIDTSSTPISFDNASFQGYMLCEKSTLGIIEFSMTVQTMKKVGIIKIPIEVEIMVQSDPSFHYFDFPLDVGKNWTIPSSTITIKIISSYMGDPEFKLFQKTFVSNTMSLSCTELGPVLVDAGEFSGYKITDSSGLHEGYFASDVKNFVKVDAYNLLMKRTLQFELVSTSIGASDIPKAPDAPKGPTVGNVGETYSYCIKHLDSDFEVLYYQFDWDDENRSDWIGPYEKGSIVCMDHAWKNNGSYAVKVRSRSLGLVESPWSDECMVFIGDIDDRVIPEIRIVKPEQYRMYINDVNVGSFPFIFVFGHVTVISEAEDVESGIDHVEFVVNGEKKAMDYSEPFSYEFDEPPGRYTITSIAFDRAGNMNSDSIKVLSIN